MTASFADLKSLLSGLAVPKATGINAIAWPGAPNYRLGRGLEGSTVLLTPADSEPEPATVLRRVTLAPRLRCRVEDGSGNSEVLDAGFVEFRDDAPELTDHFLRVAATLVESLGPKPAPGAVSRAMGRLLRIFESFLPARGSVIGVWGELLVMLNSTDVPSMMAAWHAQIDDRFDFSTQGSRLEVKTTTRAIRIHHFGLEQLLPVPGADQHVISVITAESGSGTTVADLVAALQVRLSGDASLQLKLLEQVALILGPEWPATAKRAFDRATGEASLRLFAAADIPRVDPGPPAVSDVSLSVELTHVSSVNPAAVVGLGRLIRLG